MTKKLGFWSIVLLTINSIVGAGIFLSPSAVISKAGDKTPYIYLSAALFASILAITFASASKYVTKSGAAYAYAKAAFGENLGLYVGITRFIAACIAWGVLATGVVKIVITLVGKNSNDFFTLSTGFVLLMIILLIINILGKNIFKLINNISTVAKLTALILVILTGLFIVISTKTNHFSEINSLTSSSGKPLIPPMSTSTFVMSTIAALYAFTGFESVASGSGDMEKPEINLPRAIPLAIFIIALIYTLIVTVSIMVNPKGLIETSQVVALVSLFNNSLIKNITLYGALISMFGINVASSFHSPRILEAIANEKQLSSWFTKRTKYDFPLRSFLITEIIAMVIPMSFKYSMDNIIIISSISRFIQFIIVPIAVIMFFYGKNKEKTLGTAPKNFLTDVLFPFIGLILTLILLFKFNWVGMFVLINKQGVPVPNLLAISAMLMGYIILPSIIIIINKKRKRKKC